jgi:crossover junction endodeoxyribonuclease RuvC
MVKQLLRIPGKLQADAADALAIALCHAHMRFNVRALGGRRSSSWRNYRLVESA